MYPLKSRSYFGDCTGCTILCHRTNLKWTRCEGFPGRTLVRLRKYLKWIVLFTSSEGLRMSDAGTGLKDNTSRLKIHAPNSPPGTGCLLRIEARLWLKIDAPFEEGTDILARKKSNISNVCWKVGWLRFDAVMTESGIVYGMHVYSTCDSGDEDIPWTLRLTHMSLGDLNTILKMHFSILFYWLVSSELSVIKPSDDDMSTLLQVMAWCRHAISHGPSQYWSSWMTPYGLIRQQWVKLIKCEPVR